MSGLKPNDPKVSSFDIKTYRDKHSVSVQEAKRILTKQYIVNKLLIDIDAVDTVDDIKPILRDLVLYIKGYY